MNYYPFHVGDYAAHTKHLSLMEDLAYRRLLDAYYLAERPFTGCARDVAREIGMLDHLESVEYVLNKFFIASEVGFSSKRCDEEIAAYQDKQAKASKAGKASAERRSNARSTSVQKEATSVEKSATDVQPTNNQNQNHISTTTARAKLDEFAMVPDWRPSEKFPAVARLVGASVRFTDEDVGEFVSYWLGRPSVECTQHAWEHKFTQNLKAKSLKVASKAPRKSFREQDKEQSMQKWEQMTGRIHPDRDQSSPAFIDVIDAKLLGNS